jgi:hypothetical protein
VSLLTSFFLAISLDPVIRETAQEELDAVLGSLDETSKGKERGRVPTRQDREKGLLPYIEGILCEVLR